MTTIKDVARLAGVSTTTVSHVLNKTRFVAENTTKKVWAAVDSLNYAPSAVARSLKCNSTRTIGMLVTKSNNPFFAEVVHSVEAYCYDQGFTLILCNTEGNVDKQKDYLRMLAEKRVDGLLVMCTDANDDFMDMLEKKQNVPMVVMEWGKQQDEKYQHLAMDRIQDNAELGGYLATRHLIDMGHKHIACISGQLERETCRLRLKGYQNALDEAGIALNKKWIVEADFECDAAVIATKQLMSQPQKPSAIFCFNDIMALAVISTLRQTGLDVPNDISVIGYDNIDLAPFFSPPLSTIHQPKKRLGKHAVKLLLDRIKNKNIKKQVIQMQPELIQRQSVKALA